MPNKPNSLNNHDENRKHIDDAIMLAMMYSAMNEENAKKLQKAKIQQKHPRPIPIIRPIPTNIPDNLIL